MEFERIPKKNAGLKFGYISSSENFYRFVEDYHLSGVKWSQPITISASYFLRLLQEGSSARARGYGRGYNTGNDENCNDMNEFYTPLLDHGALWKTSDGRVICTAMPYGTQDSIVSAFDNLKNKFDYPDTIEMEFLDDKYRFRENGDYMIIIYSDVVYGC